MRQPEPSGDARRDGDRPVGARRDDAVHALLARELLDRGFILRRDGRAAVGEREARGSGALVGDDDVQPACAGCLEQP
jgi:hypothetical protein